MGGQARRRWFGAQGAESGHASWPPQRHPGGVNSMSSADEEQVASIGSDGRKNARIPGAVPKTSRLQNQSQNVQ
ncbi:hypothetical protein CR159_17875 [Pollutimonas subterranea]|uniref:Uncharacterized protein n=1 Tax=Pollutimonas subterranea TaxID=2045210 RepID=A0A2N4U0J5_9BURK|nr:hypothetical protein CR159_17875 [Pollutimonas subterranea]